MALCKVVKRADNLLDDWNVHRVPSAIIQSGPDMWSRNMSTEVFNIERGDIAHNNTLKHAFKAHRNAISSN